MSVELRAVTEDEAEIRLDRWFRRHFPAVTQGAIQKLCRTGQIRVDGKRAEAATRLAPGQAVRVPPLARRAAASPAAAGRPGGRARAAGSHPLPRRSGHRAEQAARLGRAGRPGDHQAS